MRILELQISGLRSHRGNPATELNLAGKPLVAIVGPTGAGKSSLFEAVCFAIYGEGTSGGGTAGYRDLASDGRTEISVRMIFTIGPDRYQLCRSVRPVRPRRGAPATGAFVANEVWLRKLGPAGVPEEHIDQVRHVNAKMKALLGGMDRAQFCQAVLLAQNRFADLLTADPKQRDDLLDNLLGLNALRAASRAANVTRKKTEENMRRVAEARDRMPVNPVEAAAEALARATGFEILAGKAVETDATLEESSRELVDLTARADALDVAATLRGGSTEDGLARLGRARAVLETLAETDDALRGEETAIRASLDAVLARVASLGTALAEIEDERGETGSHAVAHAQLTALRSLHAELPLQRRAVDAASRDLASLEVALAEAEVASRAAVAAADAAHRHAVEAAAAATTAKAAADARSTALDDARRLVDRAGMAAGAVESATDALAAARDAAARARSEVAEHQAALAVAEAHLVEVRRADAAASAAHDLSPGDRCPICETTLAGTWTPPAGGGVARAEEAATAARGALDRSIAATATAEAGVAAATNAVSAAVDHVAGLLVELLETATRGALPGGADLSAAEVGDAPAVAGAMTLMRRWLAEAGATLKPLEEAAGAARAAHESAVSASGAAVAVATSTAQAAAALGAELASANARETAARRAVTDTERRLRGALDGIDRRWAALVDILPSAAADGPGADLDPAATADADPVAKALAVVDADAVAVAQANDALRAAEAERAALTDRLAGNLADRHLKIVTRLETATVALTELAQLVASLAESVDTTPPPPIPAGASPVELIVVVRAIHDAADAAAGAARDRAQALRTTARSLAGPARALVSDLVDLLRTVDPDGTVFGSRLDVDDPLGPGTAREIQRLVGAAGQVATRARAEADAAAAAVPVAARLDERLVSLRVWAADLDAAADALKKDRFPAWARLERTAELIATGSDLLATMTNGRYRFADGLRIVDQLAGTTRSASTLSGGEKFEASLALALAVADIAGRSGVRFETLFLDEGFAGLDGTNLARALDAIETQVAVGHSIVLITHIGAVADRIPDVLLVEPDALGGCTTTWLTEDQRFELGADLDLAVG